jgi:diguanylate cyclase (GGDEF)-like protein
MPKTDKIAPQRVDEGTGSPAEGARAVDLAAVPTQADLLRRSLGLSATITREMTSDPAMDPELRGTLSSVVALLNDWARLSGALTEKIGERGDEVTKLREVIAAQTHRIQMAEEMLADMEQLANKDHLTGAWNSLALDRVGPGLFDRMKQSEKPLSMIFMDLDCFKKINDAYGHDAGDRVLISLVKVVGDQSRLSDFLFRLGGAADELCLLLPETDIEGATILAERIRIYLEQNPIKYEGSNLLVTASIGVAQADFSKHKGFEEIKKQADIAQKVAKSTRNTVVSYHHAKGMPESYAVRSPDNRYIPPQRDRYDSAEVTAVKEAEPATA